MHRLPGGGGSGNPFVGEEAGQLLVLPDDAVPDVDNSKLLRRTAYSHL